MNTKKLEIDPIPEEFRSLEEAGAFWDTHSAANYWNDMEDVDCQVDIQERRFVVVLEDVVYRAVERAAATRHLPPDDLVNQLLRRDLLVAE